MKKKILSLILSFVMIFCATTSGLTVSAATKNTVSTSISKVESKSKGFKVTWKKKSNVKGYQIQYSTSSKFKQSSTKTKTFTSAKTTSVTISKLSGCGKKYYVRVRTYKVSKGKKIYSTWSKTKTVTTLKHSYNKATCTKAKTCKYCGKTSGKKLGHKYTNSCDTKCNTCGATRTIKHSYKAATCTKPMTCSVCKKTSGKALGHKYTNSCDTKCNTCGATRTIKHSYKAATCTKPMTCSVCKKTSGKALGHKYTNSCDTKCNTCGATRTIKHSYKAATCTKPMTCSVCKKTSGNALGHKYTNACDTTCNTCGATRTINHFYKDATCTEPKTCKTCGETEGEALGHSYADATCTTPKTCSTCGETVGEALGHSFADATCTVPKTCITCGETEGEALGHSYINATCDDPKICTTCGYDDGTVLGHNYVAGECTRVVNGVVCGDYDESYCPKLYFTGDMSEITNPKQTNKKIECEIDFEYRSHDQVVNGAAKIKLQGNSSLKYAKKNYTINFYEDPSFDKKQKIDVGWGAESKYCLKANWIDKTHSRNIISARIASQAQAKYGLFSTAPNNGTIDGFPVEIYINGEFHGLYTMNIPKDEWMFDMDKDNPNHIVICGENWNDPVLFKTVPTDLNDWTVEAGPEDDATLKKVQRLVDFVLNSSDEEFKQNFEQYLNLDSTLNYFVLMSYFWASDNTGKNMLLATYDGNVWYPTLYDLDTTWGSHWEGNKLYDYSKGFVNGSNSILWKRFQENFSKELADRYFELRQDVLDPEHVMDEFRAFYEAIPVEVIKREEAKWDTVETPIPGYELSQIQHYLETVVPRLDTTYAKWK